MTEPDSARLVRAFYEEAWNRWNDQVVDELLADTFRFRGSLGDELVGRGAWRAYRDRLRAAVPDFHNDIVELLATPDSVAVRLRCTGHQHGPLLGVPGHGRAIDYSAAAFFTCRSSVLVAAWVLGDLDALRSQLGPGPRLR